MKPPTNRPSQKLSAWRFVQLAFKIRTSKPAEHHVLLIIANHADEQGGAFPSYKRIMQESAYTSRQTIHSAIAYLRDELKVLSWRKGWGNKHTARANAYQLDYAAMAALVERQALSSDSPAMSSDQSGMSNELSRMSNDNSRMSSEAGKNVHVVDTNVPCYNVPSNTTSHSSNVPDVTTSHSFNAPCTNGPSREVNRSSTDGSIDRLPTDSKAGHIRPIEECPIDGQSRTIVPLPVDAGRLRQQIEYLNRLLATNPNAAGPRASLERYQTRLAEIESIEVCQ